MLYNPMKSDKMTDLRKHIAAIPIMVLLLLLSSCGQRSRTPLLLINPSDQPREDATLRLTRGEIGNWTGITEGQLPFITDVNGEALPSQVDDVDGDGTWDEVFALVNLEGGEQKKVYLGFIAGTDYPSFPARTNLRLGDASSAGYPELTEADRLEGVTYHNHGITGTHYQMEGPAWENDLVGFRNYLDQRNGNDIFGKVTREMILDSVGIAGGPSYHEPDWWGMDVLKVGTSLGAGSLAYLYKDSLYRLGDNGPSSYRVLFEGSQRSRFLLDYPRWKAGDKTCHVKQEIEIAGGKRYYQCQATNLSEDMDLVVGIVNLKSDSLHIIDAGPNHVAMYTLDLQAEDTTMLAMALLLPSDYLVKYGEAPESGEGITSTYYAVLDASKGEPLSYRFYSLWEKEDPRWASAEAVEDFLREEGKRWTQSVIVQPAL